MYESLNFLGKLNEFAFSPNKRVHCLLLLDLIREKYCILMMIMALSATHLICQFVFIYLFSFAFHSIKRDK